MNIHICYHGDTGEGIKATPLGGSAFIRAGAGTGQRATFFLSDEQVDQIAEVLNGVIAARDPAILTHEVPAEEMAGRSATVGVNEKGTSDV